MPDKSPAATANDSLEKGFRLGGWTVRPRRGTVESSERVEHLEPRVMAALLCMARRPGDTVTHEEFIREVWNGRIVSDEVLSRCISILRSTFNDPAREPRYIQTIPKVGYRLIATVEPADAVAEATVAADAAPITTAVEAPHPAVAPADYRKPGFLAELRRRNVFRIAAAYGVFGWFALELLHSTVTSRGGPTWLMPIATTIVLLGWPTAMAVAWLFEPTRSGFRLVGRVPAGESLADVTGRRLDYVILLALVGAFLYALFAVPNRNKTAGDDYFTAEPNSLAVLPFANLGGPEDDYLGDGLAEDLQSRLASVPDLKVVARTSSFAFKGKSGDLRNVGRRLGVQYLVAGSVRRTDERVRISAQLVDTRRGYQIWSQAYQGSLENIVGLQNDIALAIVQRFPPQLRDRATQALERSGAPTVDVAAYELFLRGQHQLAIREEEHIVRAIDLFQQALKQDPTYIDAWVELAKAQALLPSYSLESPDDMYEQALATIAAGSTRAPGVAEHARDVMAFMDYRRWRWLDAQRGFDAAIALKPGDSNVLQWYSQLLAAVGRPAESLRYALRAHAIDVLSPVVNDRLAVSYMWNDQDELADRQFEVSRELGMHIAAQPDAYLLLLLRRKRFDEARELAMDLQRMFSRPADWLDPFLRYERGTGSREAAVAAVARAESERDISKRYAFGAWMMLGEDDRALKGALELVRDPPEFEVEFIFSREARGLRRHPRFGELVRQLGLDTYWDATGWPENCRKTGDLIKCDS